MATEIYKTGVVYLIDGTEIEMSPLKIKYLREFMVKFEDMKDVVTNEEAMNVLSDCATVCMKQFYPSIKTIEELQDSMDMPTVYKILELTANIKINKDSEEPVKDQAESSKNDGMSWDELDLAKLESEVFLLGIWKDYDELERSLCMSELIITLGAKRDSDYEDKKFLAAIQGIDLDKNSGEKKGQQEWEDMKARVFSKGQATDSKDVLALQGATAQKAGFGIGMGLDYEDARDPSVML
jgi:hypothetical protein